MKSFRGRRIALPALLLLLAAAVIATAQSGAATSANAKPLIRSAISVDGNAETITLPLFKGQTAAGEATWYVVIDSSSRADAKRRGVNFAPRLGKALGTGAVEKAHLAGSTVVFPGTVNFAPKRVVVPSATGFPPTKFAPGAVGDQSYSPLVTTGDGVVLDAPQVKNATGQSDTVVSIDTSRRQVTLKLLRGFFNGTSVLYLRTDGSGTLVTALEASTYAPNLGKAPDAANSGIIPVINGPLGKNNPKRQGLESAVLGQGDPLNITQTLPGSADYSPVWDLHPVVWTAAAIKAGKRTQLTSTAQIVRAFKAGLLTSAGKGPADPTLGGVRALGMISICSTVAIG
ncbi:MAG: hypothetical protein H0X39_10280 [Actinobacteria bacterium]|nr:hypothetical protein [Actinomycetota bacterium]